MENRCHQLDYFFGHKLQGHVSEGHYKSDNGNDNANGKNGVG